MNRLSLLESLPNELLVQVLSSAISLEDLACIVFTSSRLYNAFRSARKVILVNILICNLGPTFRDIAAAGLIEPLRPFAKQDRPRLIETYRQVLSQGFAQIVRKLSLRTVLRVIPLYRDVQYIVEQYVISKRPVSRGSYPEPAYHVSELERQHFAQAVIRNEIRSHLIFEHKSGDPEDEAVTMEFLDLFGPRARELCHASSFLDMMPLESLRRCDRFRGQWRKETYAAYRECPQFYTEMDEALRAVRSGFKFWRHRRMVDKLLNRLVIEKMRIYPPINLEETRAIAQFDFETFWEFHYSIARFSQRYRFITTA